MQNTNEPDLLLWCASIVTPISGFHSRFVIRNMRRVDNPPVVYLNGVFVPRFVTLRARADMGYTKIALEFSVARRTHLGSIVYVCLC